ncbi:MAG TPA: TIGR00730 family Rossman fold protein [Rhizomicrobium sp.]|jgi:hypothetical protein
MDTPSKAICVFCASSHGADPAFTDAARALGRLIAEQGYAMVFGGGNIGLMGETARAAREAGTSVTGILPEFLRHLEPPLRKAEELVLVPDLYVRKREMIARAGAFVILPGGPGTMDEFFEVVTSAQLGQHDKPIVLVNLGGFFDVLESLMLHMIEAGFAQDSVLRLYHTVATPEDAIKLLGKLLKP